jgi:hypothetical protein
MRAWERLCFVLETAGPQTTGALGHVEGIGQNVRGIKREAERNLADGLVILSYETWEEDPKMGLPRLREWATYELVSRERAEAVRLMHQSIGETNRRVIAERRRALDRPRRRRRVGGRSRFEIRPGGDPRFGPRVPAPARQPALFGEGR